MFKIDLGQEVKDKVTGWKGIVVSRQDYITGCKQYGVATQKLDKDGDIKPAVWFDEDRLIVLKKKISLTAKSKKRRSPGGPQRAGHGRTHERSNK